MIDAYLEGDLLQQVREEADRKLRDDLADLTSEEAAVFALLRSRLADEERRAKRRGRKAA